MIVFELKCRNGHQFDAWFNNASNFEKLRKGGHVACAICGSTRVDKALAAPRISTSKKRGPAAAAVSAPADTAEAAPKPPGRPRDGSLAGPGRYANDPSAAKAADLMKQLNELRGQIEKNCDYVGKRFPEEARKMHYGEAPKRNIYGEASDGEAKALADEGVEFSRIPWAQRRDS
ncbi:MAG: DUF1178 family protein [Alphaproteobacteria bacterium]|nr:DUF1178 family protein [Alphaproteobacteria bacterium]